MTEQDPAPLSDDLAALLAHERTREGPPPELSARLEARLAQSLGSGGGSGGGASLARPIATHAAALAAGIAIGAAALFFLTPASEEPRRERSRSTISRPMDIVGPASPVPREAIALRAPAPVDAAPEEPTIAAGPVPAEPRLSPPRRVRDAGDTDRGLGEERAEIEIARSALARGDGSDALEAIDRHAARFADGRLAEERESLRVVALASLGRAADARAAAERFHARYPGSLSAPIVDRAIARTVP